MGRPAPDASDRIFLRKLCVDIPKRQSSQLRELFHAVLSMPKADLHCHLAGSMRPDTLKNLARTIPSLDWSFCDAGFGSRMARTISEGSVDEVKHYLEYRKKNGSLSDYMLAYALPKTVLASEAAIRRVAFEVCEDSFKEGVRYLEIRFNPRRLTGRIGTRQYLEALAEGLDRAARRYPSLEAVLLLSLVKDYEPEIVDRLLDEVLEANRSPAVRGKVKGLDSAGNEIGFSIASHAKAFERARKAGLGVVCHAGESFACLEDGISMIEEAVSLLGAGRIGHGLAAGLDPFSMLGTRDMNGRLYDAKRVKRIAARQGSLRGELRKKDVLIEVCPSSNLHTGNIATISAHPIGVFLSDNVPVAICTDNRWVSHTKLSWEIVRVAKAFGLGLQAVERIVAAPFRHKLSDLVARQGA